MRLQYYIAPGQTSIDCENADCRVENLWAAIPVGRLREDTAATPHMSLSLIGFVTFAEKNFKFFAYLARPNAETKSAKKCFVG
jgi:hypothetical protein